MVFFSLKPTKGFVFYPGDGVTEAAVLFRNGEHSAEIIMPKEGICFLGVVSRQMAPVGGNNQQRSPCSATAKFSVPDLLLYLMERKIDMKSYGRQAGQNVLLSGVIRRNRPAST